MDKNIICPACSSVLAKVKNNKIVFNNMKAVSILEFSLDGSGHLCKCHSCHNWVNIDSNNNTTLNYKRKGNDLIFDKSKIAFRAK